jgi:hypothetical protein
MYCIARQRVLPPLSQEQAETVLTEAGLQSLTELFEAVPDPRGAHGLRYDLPFSTSLFDRRALMQLRWDRRGRPMVSRSRELAARRRENQRNPRRQASIANVAHQAASLYRRCLAYPRRVPAPHA